MYLIPPGQQVQQVLSVLAKVELVCGPAEQAVDVWKEGGWEEGGVAELEGGQGGGPGHAH